MTTTELTPVEEGLRLPFGDPRNPLTWAMYCMFGVVVIVAIVGFIVTCKRKKSVDFTTSAQEASIAPPPPKRNSSMEKRVSKWKGSLEAVDAL